MHRTTSITKVNLIRQRHVRFAHGVCMVDCCLCLQCINYQVKVPVNFHIICFRAISTKKFRLYMAFSNHFHMYNQKSHSSSSGKQAYADGVGGGEIIKFSSANKILSDDLNFIISEFVDDFAVVFGAELLARAVNRANKRDRNS